MLSGASAHERYHPRALLYMDAVKLRHHRHRPPPECVHLKESLLHADRWDNRYRPTLRGGAEPSRRKKDAHRSRSVYPPLSRGDAPSFFVRLMSALLTFCGYRWRSISSRGHAQALLEPDRTPHNGSIPGSGPGVEHMSLLFLNAHM